MTIEDIAGHPHTVLESIDSTNEEARRRVQAGGVRAPFWLSAKQQSQGRGRQGREWMPLAGNLYASFVMPAPKPPLHAARLSFACAVAVAEAAAQLSGGDVQAGCKWPNDVLIGGNKLAGILLETAPDPHGMDWLIMGMGVNIAGAPEGASLRRPATYLSAHLTEAVTAGAFLSVLGAHLDAWVKRLEDHGFDALHAAWMRRAYGVGQRVLVAQGTESLQGQFLGIDEQGAARLRLDSGIEKLIHAGEIVFRPEME